MFKDIHHVGYLVENMDEAVAAYERVFGGKLLSKQYSASGKSTNAFVQSGDTLVELMEPDDKSRLGGAKGQVLHHVGYLVPDIQAAMKELQSRGVRMVHPTPYVNTAGWKIAYFDGGPALGAGLHLIEV